MSSSNSVRIAYKKESTYGTKVDAVKAFLVVQDITYTAKKGGSQGNSITIQYTTGAVAGAEVVTVTGNAIVVEISSGVSTATQVVAAVSGSAAAMLLLGTPTISGVAGTAQVTAASAPLATGAKEFKTARFTSEKYSGTPQTTESAQIRTDRMSSGQVVTGLQVTGGHNFELAKEGAIEDFLESAMYNSWSTTSITNTLSLALDATARTITRGSGSYIDEGLKVGDVVILSDFASAGNNAIIMITVLTDTVLTYAGPTGMATVTESATFTRADKLTIGTTAHSLSIEKAFLDLTNKAIIYKGALVSQMSLDVQYGQLISGSFETSANDYESADQASEFISYGEYIAAQATTETLNGSVDMPFLTTNVTGSFAQDAFCLQSLKLTMSNNLQAQTCIGRSAPENYSAGTAAIKVELSSYLKDANWDLLALKLSQAAFSIGFLVKNTDGWYGFFLPAVQVSFDDPASGGANQQISMNMSGTAKVGATGESALAIYRLPG